MGGEELERCLIMRDENDIVYDLITHKKCASCLVLTHHWSSFNEGQTQCVNTIKYRAFIFIFSSLHLLSFYMHLKSIQVCGNLICYRGSKREGRGPMHKESKL